MQARTAAFWAVGFLLVAVALWAVTLAMAFTPSWGSMIQGYGRAVMRPPDDMALVGLLRILVGVALVGGFVLGGYSLLRRLGAAWPNYDEALAVARLRYARGEISREAFQQLEADLSGGARPTA